MGVCCGVGLRFVVFPLTVFVTVVAFAVAWFLLVFGTTVVSFNSVVLYCSCVYESLLYCLIDCVIVLLFCVVLDWFVAVDIAGGAGVCGFDLSGGLAVRGFG